jgi:alpha-L-fucosidase 2
MSSMQQLWYNRPAGDWHEALPLGNGRIGAMVFGATGRERIELNEDTLWSGRPVMKTATRSPKRSTRSANCSAKSATPKPTP